jgi:transcriptional regulator with XRE-family HTH domain
MNQTQAVRLGRLLVQARLRRGLSLRAVAELADVAYLWLSRVEHGLFHQPAPERIMRVADVLGIDPERVDRVTNGHVSSNLPGLRSYFRAKYDLSLQDIDEIERTVNEIQRKHGKEERP